MKKSTSINHPPEVALPPGNHPLVMPIYQSVKFDFENLDDTLEFLRGERPGFFYTRASNPTTRQLELQLAAMQGRMTVSSPDRASVRSPRRCSR